MARVWKIAPGEAADDWALFRQLGCIGLGWLSDSNYRDYRDKDEITAALEQHYGRGVQGCGAGAAKMIWQFVHEVKPHDVIVANERYNRVVGIGVVTSEYLPPRSTRNPIRKDTSTRRHHIRRVDWRTTDELDLPEKRFFVQSTFWPLETEKLNQIREEYLTKYPKLKTKLNQVLVGYHAGVSGLMPEEVPEATSLFEGAVRRVTVNAYERNPVAREKCISTYGTACCICRFDFGKVYGPEAEGYIHVHHVRPLSEVGEKYVVDLIADLRPVCPNCHAVLHLGGRSRSIDEVNQLLVG